MSTSPSFGTAAPDDSRFPLTTLRSFLPPTQARLVFHPAPFQLLAVLGKVFASTAVIASAIGWVGTTTATGPTAGTEVGVQTRHPTIASAALPVPTLQSIELAGRTQDYTADLLRRFFDGGNVVTVRERQEVDADGSKEPNFVLTFLGVIGEPPGSALHLHWQHVYETSSALLFRSGTFRILDLVHANNNYVLHDFGPVVRAGRSARRMVVFPNLGDKAICVIDVDLQTSVPLYLAEFDPQLHLLTELEAVSFAPTVQPIAGTLASDVAPITSFAEAQILLGNPPGILEPDPTAASEYALDRIEVLEDPINGYRQLLMSYTDGIDQ